MNPYLEFSQGVYGVSTGRSYGIIDTLQLVDDGPEFTGQLMDLWATAME